jgi:hypothetical protein
MVSAEMIANPHTFSEMKVVSDSIQIYSIEIIKLQFLKVSTRKMRARRFSGKNKANGNFIQIKSTRHVK